MKISIILLATIIVSLKVNAQIINILIPKIELKTKPQYHFGEINKNTFKLKNEGLSFDKAIENFKVKKINRLNDSPINLNTIDVSITYNMPCFVPSNEIKNHILVFYPTENITNTTNQMPNPLTFTNYNFVKTY